MKTNPSRPSLINVGVLGLGTVGRAVVDTLLENAPGIFKRSGVRLKVKLGCDVRKVKVSCPLTQNPRDIINDPEISVVVETIGGINPAKKYVLAAISAGKHVVTSNKELIALHMGEIFSAAAENGVSVFFEGAVAGGIPILNTLREELSSNHLEEIYGIVNGTTNYILSKMTSEKKDFHAALKEAQALGFAEADPKADVEGYDASYKAVILAASAFDVLVKWTNVYREGIGKISPEDIRYAEDIGYVVKLLAVVKRAREGFDVRVHPALVAKSHPLSNVSANFNAVYVKGSPVGELMFYGPGAGGAPTSSSVVSDMIRAAKIAAGRQTSRTIQLESCRTQPINEIESRYYLRLEAPDRHGVLAGISKVFADKKVSISAVMQKESSGGNATIIILLHKVVEQNLKAALQEIQKLSVVRRVCNVIRIL